MKNLMFIHIIVFSILLSGCASSESTASKSTFEYPESCEEPRQPPKLLNLREIVNTYQEYPEDLRSRGIEGRVFLEVLINETGSIEEIEAKQSPHYQLTEVARNAAKHLKAEPGTCSGKPTAMNYNFALSYYVNSSF